MTLHPCSAVVFLLPDILNQRNILKHAGTYRTEGTALLPTLIAIVRVSAKTKIASDGNCRVTISTQTNYFYYHSLPTHYFLSNIFSCMRCYTYNNVYIIKIYTKSRKDF